MSSDASPMADLDPKALEAAASALARTDPNIGGEDYQIAFARSAITAYLSALVPTPPPVEAAQEPVAWPDGEGIVTIYDPRGEVFPKQGPHKIIDASMSFMHEAKVGDRLYSQAQVEEIVRASLYAAPATGWRTMESAPKDGTQFLISGGTFYYDGSDGPDAPFTGVCIAHWDTLKSEWNGGYGSEYDGEYWHQPMYWMPLPTPKGEA